MQNAARCITFADHIHRKRCFIWIQTQKTIWIHGSPDHGSYLGGSKGTDRQWTYQSHGYKYAEDSGADRQVQSAYILQSYIPHTYGAAMYRWFIQESDVPAGHHRQYGYRNISGVACKKTLDKMSMLNAPHSIVVRDGEQQQIQSEELVKDDIIILSAGNQICADATVLSGSISVNEALLTGESDEIKKKSGDRLMSGSFVVSGQCYAKLDKVGNESYISQLTAQAKAMGDGEQSEMIRYINKLVKWVGIIIIPVGIILFCQAYIMNGETFKKSVVSMVAAVLGMIPEGLYLLTTVALALSTIRLAKKQVLLHDMKSIETLARVDVLCVDKTGTITEPGMQVTELVISGRCGDAEMDKRAFAHLLADYSAVIEDNNATMEAIRAYVAKNEIEKGSRTLLKTQPFTSANKYSKVSFVEGDYMLGAPEFIMKDRYEDISEEIEEYQSKGYRVLLMAESGEDSIGSVRPLGGISPIGYIVLSNPIRKMRRAHLHISKSRALP